MGKGKGGFDHWSTMAPAGKILFEVSAPGVRVEIVRRAMVKAASAIPGPMKFVNKETMGQPAYCGHLKSPIYHAGIKVEGQIDKKIRVEKVPHVVLSKQAGQKKRERARKGLTRVPLIVNA
jgi:Ribosomal protein L16p/L10e